MIRSDAGFTVVLCHFKNGSVARKAGERVQPGDLLGLCGNSGNSSEPHLHLHVQSEPGFVRGEAMRPVFRSVEVDGTARINYSPRKNDVIAPVAGAGKEAE
jgi:murein DD-endopeptidase MepM/ murein hydrolase activator NlpD